MAYDEALAARVRRVLSPGAGVARDGDDIVEKKMFGGLAVLSGGRMFCGVIGRDLVVRVGPEGWKDALAKRHVRPMDFTGKPLTGYVYVAPTGVRTAATLRSWVRRGLAIARTVPAPKHRPRPRAPARRVSARVGARGGRAIARGRKPPGAGGRSGSPRR